MTRCEKPCLGPCSPGAERLRRQRVASSGVGAKVPRTGHLNRGRFTGEDFDADSRLEIRKI